jgi:hypothetical protein
VPNIAALSNVCHHRQKTLTLSDLLDAAGNVSLVLLSNILYILNRLDGNLRCHLTRSGQNFWHFFSVRQSTVERTLD